MTRVVALALVFFLVCAAAVLALSQSTPQLPAPTGSTVTRQTWRESLSSQFPDLGRELKLAPEAADKFLDLLARQQADLWADAVDIVIGEADEPATRLQWQRKLVEQLRANQAELVAALGDRYTRWLQYQGSLAIGQQVERLRARLGDGDNALPRDFRPMTEALVAEQLRLDDELRAWLTSAAAAESPDLLDEHLRRRADGRDRLLGVASTWLGTAQQAEYRQVLDLAAAREAALKRVVGLPGTAPVQPRPDLVSISN